MSNDPVTEAELYSRSIKKKLKFYLMIKLISCLKNIVNGADRTIVSYRTSIFSVLLQLFLIMIYYYA